ncbi:sulfotransferase family 2 domain-containing protein [Coraliomargarita parva]|uniref:sulfotransferase family 2 domain-containing protein n=1 Tax=Coraliomargarita parva TaxID=3014050 RepID=UPI0022B3D9C5|nr:sulfotransferase family 2 domain-containing protein [Coraliomargarita parva]
MTVISHKYKFIFVKTGKTAGTSVEMALNKICGPEDVCSPLSKWWKKPRPGEESHNPQNAKGFFLPHPFLKRPWRSGRGWRIKGEFREFMHGWKYRSHMSAIEIRARLGKKLWNEYFKFTIDRNPWDKAVSAYYFAQRNKKQEMPFEEWVQRYFPDGTIDFYSINGEIAVDRVLRYENLAAEFRQTLIELGVPNPPELPQAKANFRPDRASYQSVHNEVTKNYVAQACAREIKAFDYQFSE